MDFLVRKDDLNEVKFEEGEQPELEPGQAMLEIESYGLTANNLTYAVMGETMSYWDFFPGPDGWGRLPVWGFARVADAGDSELKDGSRVYGYLPAAGHLVVRPSKVAAGGFVDASDHRSKLPSAYNGYLPAGDGSETSTEDLQTLLWPLFFTSFMLDDFLGDEGLVDGNSIVISSASSRTASAAAFLLSRREGAEVVGLTSPRNVEFVNGLGVYERAVPYEELGSLSADPTVYVDITGDAALRASVHEHFGESLVHDSAVGFTHHDRAEHDGGGLPGPKPTFFFAPDRIKKRGKDWGREGIAERVLAAWGPYADWAGGWLEVSRTSGADEIEGIYRELLDGGTDPAIGHVIEAR